MTVEYATLRGTSLRLSRIAFGCEPLGGTDWGVVDDGLVREAVAHALDVGVTVFDTADVYGLGRSERALAEVLGARARDVVIMTKGGVNWRAQVGGRASTYTDLNPRHIGAAVERSLRRLRIDCIPLYFLHRPDPDTPVADTLEVIERCIEQGKIRYFGVSNFSATQVREAHRLLPVRAVQFQYNLLDRNAETSLLPTCRALGIDVLAYGPLAQGLLGGRYDGSSRFGPDDRRHRLPQFHGQRLLEGLALVERARCVGSSYGASSAQVALRWVLESEGIACAITGAKTAAQIAEDARAGTPFLSDGDLALLSAPLRADEVALPQDTVA